MILLCNFFLRNLTEIRTLWDSYPQNLKNLISRNSWSVIRWMLYLPLSKSRNKNHQSWNHLMKWMLHPRPSWSCMKMVLSHWNAEKLCSFHHLARSVIKLRINHWLEMSTILHSLFLWHWRMNVQSQSFFMISFMAMRLYR